MINSRGEQIYIPQDILDNKQLLPHAVMLYLKLKFHADKKGFISMRSQDLGHDRISINKWIKNLEFCGLVKIHDKNSRLNVFQILK